MARILILAIVVTAALASVARAQTPQRAVITYSSRSIASVDLFIAQERGFFREEGIEPQLVQVPANAAIAATVSGDVQALGSVGSAIRAIQRGVPMKVLAVSLRRPLFWLVTRPDLKTFADLKGKVAATTTIGGSQHTAGIRMLRRGGIDPEKDITVMTAGDVPTQLKALVNGTIQIGFFSPPSVIIARDKYKMNILASAMEEFSSLQNGLGVLEKNLNSKEQRDLARRMLRARAKGNRYFHQNERGSAEVLAKYLNVDLPTALETYRISLPAFTTNGIPTDDEIREYLKMDAQLMGLPAPVPAEKIFDFSLQRDVNKELGIK
jgi:NitT/TauT family transport system substrate-binding protein